MAFRGESTSCDCTTEELTRELASVLSIEPCRAAIDNDGIKSAPVLHKPRTAVGKVTRVVSREARGGRKPATRKADPEGGRPTEHLGKGPQELEPNRPAAWRAATYPNTVVFAMLAPAPR